MDVLITVSRDHKDDVLLACGECLGEFGALDPGHLPNKISLNGNMKFYLFVFSLNCKHAEYFPILLVFFSA